MGFESQTVTVKNGMRITLVEDSKTTLKGVEVVAYGVQKKVSVTGALSSVKGEDLVRTPVSSVNNVLGGQLSGVTTVQYSGEPGSDAASVFVRGQASFNDANPLVQVDGVERSMSDIDPEEIESITVLKDASATAVFGVRGANGVILITTKRGAEGKTHISGSTSWGILTPTKMVEQANSYEYATFHNLMSDLDGVTRQFSDVVVQKFKDGSDPIRFPSTRWTDYIMKNSTLQTKHNLNISGGTKKARYFINVGYYTQGGLFKEFGQDYHFDYRYNRFNYRANLDLDLTKTTTLSFNLAGNVGNANKPYTGQGSSGMIEEAYEATPFSSPGIIDGHYIATETQYDDCGTDQLPFLGGSGITYFGNNSVSGGFMKTTTNKLTLDLQLSQKLDFITKGLSFKIKGSYNGSYDIYKNGGTGFFCGRALTIANLKTCVRRYILSPKDSTFAPMNQNNDIDMYKGLAVYFLPEGVLNYFDVVAFAEEPPKKNDVLYSSELHIYLDEKDNRTSDMKGSKSKGYTEDKQILDFPVRGRKAVIHIRRKRWLMPDGSCQVVDLHKKVEIEYKGTRYSKEFALFLKMATGQ